MIVLIPAYEPGQSLVDLVADLRTGAPDAQVLVVDDGSGPSFSPVFAAASRAGAEVLGYASNRGKGAALRFGLAHVLAEHPDEPVVCADSDGQHTVADILATADALTDDRTMVLGVRTFVGDVPLRSRVGNRVTAGLFRMLTGTALLDTQTGLRAYPAALLPWLLSVKGDRFEYEMNLLLRAAGAGVSIAQVPIETIYLRENESSHFRPLRDSARIYAPIAGFAASSLAGFAVDTVGVLALHALTGSLLVAAVGARLASGLVNYELNRRLVFSSRSSVPRSLPRYVAVAVVVLAASYGLTAGLDALLPLPVAKVLAELALVVPSYRLQRAFVFRDPKPTAPSAPSAPTTRGTASVRALPARVRPHAATHRLAA